MNVHGGHGELSGTISPQEVIVNNIVGVATNECNGKFLGVELSIATMKWYQVMGWIGKGNHEQLEYSGFGCQ